MSDVYVRLSNEPVVKTHHHSDNTLNVDVDYYGVPVGVEILGALEVQIDGEVCRCAPTPSAAPMKSPLSQLEIDVLHDLAIGLTVRQIAHKRGPTPSAISMRLCRLYARMGTQTATQTVVECLARGWVRLEKPQEQGGGLHEVPAV
jgi:DNA-binding CsgD family transcriptional regulator